MKNSNLLNRLLSYSHEKQSPQRFARYAAMLIMLLTLGVGQMWAAVTLYYQKDMPSGNYSASNSASMTQSSVNSNRYSCSVSLQNGSYGFYIKNGNDFYKVSATATTNESVLLYNYGSTNYGNSPHRVTYNTGAAGDFTFTFDASNNKVCVSKRHGLTIKVAWSTASGHDGDWNLGTYTTLTEEGSTGEYSADVDLTAVKHYMFVQTDNTRYWRGSSTLSVNNSTSLYYYGNSNYGGSGDKINFTPSAAAKYRFTWNHADKTVKLQRLYNISYQKGSCTGSTGSTQTDYKVHGTNITLRSSGDFSRTGYNHTAWNTNANGTSGTSYSLGATYSTNNNLTLYPTWTAKTSTITLNNQGATTAGTTEVTATYDAAMPAITPPEKDGYTFGGYWGAPGGSGPQYYNADGSSAATWNNENATYTLYAKWTPVTWKLQSTSGDHGTFTGTGPYTLDVTYNSATMNWGAARFDLNGTSYICNNYTIGTSGKLELRAENAYTGITGMTNGASYTFTITYESGTWYVQIAENCTAPTIAWNTTPANGVAGGNMTASVTTNQTSPTITWNSSNTSAATVSSSGVITYVAAGNTRITASYTGDGSTYCSTTASVYQDITVSAAVADAWSLWYWGGSETKIGDFTPDGGDSHHLDFELTASNFQTLWLKNNSTQYVATNINANTVTNVTVTESPVGRFRDDATKGYYRFTIYKDGGGAWKLDASPIYRVTYNDNGATSGTAPTDAAGYVSGATVTVKGNTGSLAKTGYDFGGWNLSADGSGTNYTAGSGTFSITANTELFAKWNAQNYSIIYKDQGGASFSGIHVDTPSEHPTTHTYGTATTLNSATKTGYTFGGWFDNSACTGVAVTSLGATAYSDDITLYAKWTENTTTVTVNVSPANSGTLTVGGSAFTPGNTTTAGVATSRTVVASANSGYGFDYWTTSGNATGSASTNTYTLAGNGNGSTGTLTANFYTKVNSGWYMKGAAFGGWDMPTTYPFDRAYRDVANTYYRIVTLTASSYWEVHNGTTTYNTDGSTSSDKLVAKNTVYSLTSNNSKSSYTNTTMTDVWVVVNTSTKKLWIQDAATYYTITFANGSSGNTNNGAAGTEGTITTKTSNYGELSTKKFASGETIKLNVSAKTGYVIDDITIGETSVATDVNSTSYSGNTTMPAGDATLTVTYKHNYTVTYDVGTSYTSMGSVSSSPAHTSGQRVIEGTSMTFTATPNLGYKFVGWYREAACTNEVSTDNPYEQTINANTTLYAKYELLTLYMNSDINNWASEINLTHTTENAAIYKYTGTLNANPTNDAPTYASGWHFEYCYNTARSEKAYQYTSVQTPTYSGSSIDGVNTYSGANTIQFGLTRKSDVTITLTLQTAPTKPTLNIAADPYYTITYGVPTHGSYTIQVGSAAAVGASTESTAGKTITLVPSASTGYHFDSWTVTKAGGGTVTVTSNHFTMPSDDVTIAATFLPTSYDVTLKPNGATTGSDQVVRATFDAAMPPTTKSSVALVAPTKIGYTLQGFYQNSDGTGTKYYNANMTSANAWNQAGDANVWAKWNAKTTNITLDQTGAATTGSVTTRTGTYNADMPAISGANTLPVAPQGYAFMGYYDALEPLGNKYYNADGTSARTWNKEDAEATLYAYFKQAEITELVASPGVIAPGETITITPTIEPTPTGTTKVCYELQYSNGTPLPSQPTFTPGAGNAVSFPVPSASATYIIQAKLAKGSDCPADPEDVLSTRTTTFQVAGAHDVTIRYQDSDGRTLQASASIEARPLEWTTLGDITPPTITGYTFARWDAGDGVSIKNGDSDPVTTTTTPSIQIKAVYDGTLTAVYNKKNMIFFNNTLGWSDVYVYFYSSDKYWVEDHIAGQGCGTGSDQNYEVDGFKAYYRGYHGHMTQIAGTNIWYYDYEAEHGAKDGGEIKGYDDVVFVETEQNNYKFFYNNKASRRGDFNHSLPMFVPINSVTETKNGTKYYSSGYWMNYPENTGYSLLIYNQKAKAGATKLYEIPFEFTEDFTMPMELVVDLEAGQTYGYEIKRADGTYYSNTGTMTANTTNWSMSKDQSSYCGLQTTAAGNYTFRLYYSSSSYRMDVTYPVAVNDYRIVYTDLATWSKDAHTASWSHPSRVITKNSSATEIKKDTVSFFWSYGSSPAIKYQQCTATGTGSVTWNAGTAISVSDFSSVLTKVGVYNFIFEQPAGGASISLIKVEPYTGNYYIRTDCAGSSKWTNYRSTDHEMTYSDYAEVNSGYSHYYTHWVTNGTNVKFCIANDYSQCISDTLAEDYGTVIANINAGGTLESGNASIRFMWNQATNKISRAYISGSTNISDRFLVLEGDAKMYDENGNSLNITGLNANEINLVDDQNFVYERTIQVNTGAKAKLTAKYNNNVQYFKGGAGTAAADSVELLGGNAAGKHSMRIVYDFKTNRLVTAYIPSGTIEDNIAINADLMIVREHQEAGQQLLFNGGSLSKVHTVYGVMRFNRWTLNNKEKTGSHDPVGDPKSAYERALYWISFPFNVNLSDVFGFGTYGTHWIIMEYDGAERAQKGYWKDSKGFWKYVTNRNAKVLEAGKGYVLALDLDLMKYDDTSFWSHNIEQVELFFPSAAEVNNISETNVQTTVDAHECKIDRTGNNGSDINKNRTKADSHWNMIGIPSYANYGTTLTDGAGGSTITWNSNPYTNDLPFLYEWNMVDNTYTVQSGTTYPFKSMHAYMVQYHGNLYWSLASATPVSPIVARRTYAEKPQNVELRLELSQNEMKVDQTFVKLSNDENASTKFAFDEDLCKEYNANKANIYTFIEGYIPAGGNTLPMTEQTMVVPVGVQIAANGDYTFAIPEGTEGIGITLIDNETGIRTSLSAHDYTINLNAGTYNERFLLEISPVHQSPTAIELLNGENGENGVRKVLIDNILYIVKDGVMYDARGSRVQ